MIRASLPGASQSALFRSLETQARVLGRQKAARVSLGSTGSIRVFWRSASSLWPNFTQG